MFAQMIEKNRLRGEHLEEKCLFLFALKFKLYLQLNIS